MTDRRADIMAQKFQNAAPKLADAFHADTYQLLDISLVDDGYGGEIPGAPVLVESGYCSLLVVGQMGGRRLEGDIVFTETAYEVEIKPPTVITTQHKIEVNGRKFDVQKVLRGGEMDMFVVATIEETEPR